MKFWTLFQPISFQAMWFSLVWGGNAWLALAMIILASHYLLSPTPKQDIQILVLAAAGFVIDLLLSQLGVFSFAQQPLWLGVLWVAFVLNFGHSLRFLRKLKPIYLMGVSAIGGAYAYWLSFQLGAVGFPLGTTLTLGIVAINFGIVLPLLVKADAYIRKADHV